MRYLSNTNSAALFISQMQAFNGSSMSGTTNAPWRTGRLPEGWAGVYNAQRVAHDIAYVVLSWSTPIAWRDHAGRWYVPAVTYSGYSSRHQVYTNAGVRAEIQGRGLEVSDPQTRVVADRYCTTAEILGNTEAQRPSPAYRHGEDRTIRGIRNGDYLLFPELLGLESRYRTVYDLAKTKETGEWRAMTMVAGVPYWVTIGIHSESVYRLR